MPVLRADGIATSHDSQVFGRAFDGLLCRLDSALRFMNCKPRFANVQSDSGFDVSPLSIETFCPLVQFCGPRTASPSVEATPLHADSNR